MRKCRLRPGASAAVLVFLLLFSPACGAQVDPAYDALARARVERARSELANVRRLVDSGTLPKIQLAEAEDRLADAQDELVLARTLYGLPRVQDMTAGQAASMTAAADHLVERQQKIVDDKRGLVDAGILARADFEAFDQQLGSRKRAAELARNRVKLLDELRQMAEAEKRLESASQQVNVMIRYDGKGSFTPLDLRAVSREFEHRFGRSLPVSASGQTAVHSAMGLDHRNRVDVSLNPDEPAGVWLRQLLERLRVPYLAFRSALPGAATAPHIHLGLGSTRLAVSHG